MSGDSQRFPSIAELQRLINFTSPPQDNSFAITPSVSLANGLTGLRHHELLNLPDSAAAELSPPETSVRVHTALLRDELARLAAEFHARGIARDLRVLKGAAVESLFYLPRGLWRQFSDIDIWVPASRLNQTCDTAQQLGWLRTEDAEGPGGRELAFSKNVAGIPLLLELHTGLINLSEVPAAAELSPQLSDQALLDSAQPFRIGEHELWTFAPDLLLWHLCVHALVHHHTQRLIWLLDIRFALDTLPPDEFSRILKLPFSGAIRVALLLAHGPAADDKKLLRGITVFQKRGIRAIVHRLRRNIATNAKHDSLYLQRIVLLSGSARLAWQIIKRSANPTTATRKPSAGSGFFRTIYHLGRITGVSLLKAAGVRRRK